MWGRHWHTLNSLALVYKGLSATRTKRRVLIGLFALYIGRVHSANTATWPKIVLSLVSSACGVHGSCAVTNHITTKVHGFFDRPILLSATILTFLIICWTWHPPVKTNHLVIISDEDLQCKRSALQNKNTLKSEVTAANRFLLYLKGIDEQDAEKWCTFQKRNWMQFLWTFGFPVAQKQGNICLWLLLRTLGMLWTGNWKGMEENLTSQGMPDLSKVRRPSRMLAVNSDQLEKQQWNISQRSHHKVILFLFFWNISFCQRI